MKSLPSEKSVPVPPLVEKEMVLGYYWYQGQPVLVFMDNGLTARWYNFVSKTEHRVPIKDLQQSEFVGPITRP